MPRKRTQSQSVFQNWWYSLRIKSQQLYQKVVIFLQKRPLTSFFVALGVLLFVIILSSLIASSKQKVTTPTVVKPVQVYSIGTAPKVTLQAKIEKSGVIKIMAQTAGVVQTIHVTEGQHVSAGDWLVSLSTNYQGDDASGIQAAIAQRQYQNVLDSYPIQKDLIRKQRDVAQKTSDNTEQLRQISQQSIAATQDLINLDNDMLNQVNTTLATFQATASATPGGNQPLILQTQQLKAQLQSGLLQLNSQLRQTQYQTNTDNPPTQLANLQKDITTAQLDVQEKALDLNKEVSRLQAGLAAVSESLMHPAAPRSGTVERVYVTEGQLVSPGTAIAQITADDPDVTAVVLVPRSLATTISSFDESALHADGKEISLKPRYISQEATDGELYAILYSLPTSFQHLVTQGGYLLVDVPVGLPNTGSTIPFIPLDSVYQTQDTAYVYVAEQGVVKSRQVTLGNVYGSIVAVASGLQSGDQIILDRTVIAGDHVNAHK